MQKDNDNKALLSKVQDTVLAGNITNKDYHRILAEIEACSETKSLEWFKSWILLHCATRKKAFKTQKIISRFNRISRRKGRLEDYQSFLNYIVEDLKLFLPNGSSYTESFRTADTQAVINGCREIMELLISQTNLDVFVNSGTLLGLVREGTLIEYDNDIDLAIVLNGHTEEEVAKEWLALCDNLIAQGIGLSRSEWSKVTLKLNKISGFGVDLFPAWFSKEGDVYVYPHTYGNLKKSQVLPLRSHEGTGLKIPADSKAMVASNYGDNWHVPNEGWTFDWPKANQSFSIFLSCLRTD